MELTQNQKDQIKILEEAIEKCWEIDDGSAFCNYLCAEFDMNFTDPNCKILKYNGEKFVEKKKVTT